MPPSEDALPIGSRWTWLDRWFEPPWRALLTWVALVELQWAMVKFGADWLGWTRIWETKDWFYDLMNRLSPVWIPQMLYLHMFDVQLELGRIWFEPLALRLSPMRGMAWIFLRIAPLVTFLCIYEFQKSPIYVYQSYVLSVLPWSAALVLVVRGWRSRPWMCILAGALLLMIYKFELESPVELSVWLGPILSSAPYAAVLLYGTRLLNQEQRARSSISVQTVPLQ